MIIKDRPIERIAYRVSEAAETCGIGVTMMREIVARGEIRSFRLGRRILIRKSDLQAWIDEHAEGRQ